MPQFNIGPMDTQLTLSQALPAVNTNVTTGILDLQSIAPNGNAWRLGRIAAIIPALPENTVTGITIALQAAPPSLTGGSNAIAPLTPAPGAFVTPPTAQTFTIAAVAGTGSLAQVGYFTLAFDANGSPYQFYQFVITTPAGVVTVGEVIQIGWVYA